MPLRHLTAEVAIGDLEGVGYLPGLVPDPLFDETTLEAGPWETNSFWITLRIDDELRPGEYEVRVTLSAPEEQSCELSLQLLVSSAIQPRRTGFPVTHWLHADALLDWYGLESFDSDFWRILGSYIWLSGTGREQMFDLVADPAECHDLSPQHADRVRHWRSRMIEVLRGREEGYVDHDELVPGRPARDVLSTPAPWKPL